MEVGFELNLAEFVESLAAESERLELVVECLLQALGSTGPVVV